MGQPEELSASLNTNTSADSGLINFTAKIIPESFFFSIRMVEIYITDKAFRKE